MSSLRQLAQLAGVSASTVSRALRGDPQISLATRQRIQELAAIYQYHPNRLPPSRVAGKSNAIGFIIPSVSSIYFSQVLKGVLERAFSESIHVITLQTASQSLRSQKAIQTFIELQVDGILMSSGHLSAIPKSAVLEMWSHGIPAVRVGDTPVEVAMDQVTTDEEQIAEVALAHLCSLGHREIAYLGNPDLPRADAIRRRMRKHGLSIAYHRSQLDDLSLVSILDEWRKLPIPPTAVLTYNDTLAAQLMQLAHGVGMRIPQELSVIGCSNFEVFAPYLIPPLTAIQSHPFELGQQAFDLLLRRIQSGDAPHTFQPERICVSATLVKRASCASSHRCAYSQQRRVTDTPATSTVPLESGSRLKRSSQEIVWKLEDTEEALARRYQMATAPDLRPRWQALWLLRQGCSRAEVAATVGVNPRTLRDWIAWYREGGIPALATHHTGMPSGKRRRLTDQQCAHLASLVRTGAVHTIGQARDWVAQTYHVTYSYWGMRSLLDRLHKRR
ncbi:MAG: substrate-binding domain-containing protein [Armatimonadota bacterium]